MIFPDLKIIFILPPKTGTSSFLRFLEPHFIQGKTVGNYRHHFLSITVESFNIQNLEEYKIYQLCRNPLDKLISAYYFEQALPHIRGRFPKLMEWGFNEVIKLKLSNLHYLPIQIDAHNKIITDATGDIYRPGLGDQGTKLYLPQTWWNDLNLDITYLKLEDLKEDCSILSEIFNVPLQTEFPFVNSTHIRKRFSKPVLEMFDKEALELALDIYKKDFETLNYELPTNI